VIAGTSISISLGTVHNELQAATRAFCVCALHKLAAHPAPDCQIGDRREPAGRPEPRSAAPVPIECKFEAGALDDDVQAADLLQEYEAKIAALERMVGRQALEIELLKGALKHAPGPRSANTSVVTGPVASRSAGDAN
jgi:hypothetical protein